MSLGRVRLLIGTAAIAIALAAGFAAAVAWPDRSSAPTTAGNSNLNTASRPLSNTRGFVDVNDSPVSLPSERVIRPPTTGGAGLLPHEDARPAHSAVLLVLTIGLLLAARRLTLRWPVR